MATEYKVLNKYRNRVTELVRHETELPTMEAALAFYLLEKWGMVTAADAGEDSGGRQKIKLLPVKETVKRAFDMAEMAYEEMRKRKLFVALPDVETIYKESDDD